MGVFCLSGVGNIRLKWFLGLREKNINHSSFLFLSLDKIELVFSIGCYFRYSVNNYYFCISNIHF